MILGRLGNKRALASRIIKYFSPHNVYVEPFFGAGGLYFYKEKSKYNIVNDLDSEVFNLFTVVQNKRKELEKAFNEFPIHNDLFMYWKTHKETNDVKKALRFLFLSNFSYLGKMGTMVYGENNQKIYFPKLLKNTNKLLFNVQFSNLDFRKFFPVLQRIKRNDVFIYCDPPYIETENNYSNSFTEKDTMDLFELCINSGYKFMISEFDNPFIVELAEQNNLNIIKLATRTSLKKKNNEILITNYKNNATLF